MASVQSYIRAEVSHGVFPMSKGAEAFSAYAIPSGKGLVPEMENAARQTLDHPMTFEVLGEGLRLFEGWALRDLANFRKHYRDNLKSSFESFLKTEELQFKIWTPCTSYTFHPSGSYDGLGDYHGTNSYIDESCEAFSKSLFDPRSIRGEYLSALRAHIKSYRCVSCTKVHTEKGDTFCKDLEDRLMQALNEVCPCSMFWRICGSLSMHLSQALSDLISHR
jgi:hypothetical protein